MEFAWSPNQSAFRKAVRAHGKATAPEHWTEHERRFAAPGSTEQGKAFTRALAERGWSAPHWPEEYGGDADPWRHIILSEELWAIGEPRGPLYMNVNWIAPMIFLAGTGAQKQEHLERIRLGDVVWCQGFSEPDAGSDLASLRSTAVRDGDDWVLNGQKIWTSYAHVAEYCMFLARSDPDAERHEGISIFLVPMDTPGIEVRHIESFMGDHAFHEMFFTDVRVSAEAMLGKPHRGWEAVRQGLAWERVGLPRYARAIVELDRLAEWLEERGRLDDRDALRELGEARAICEAARILAYRAVDDRSKGRPTVGSANVARAAMVRADRAVAEVAGALLGIAALETESIADRTLRDAMATGLAAGSYEVQLNLIARLVLQLPRS